MRERLARSGLLAVLLPLSATAERAPDLEVFTLGEKQSVDAKGVYQIDLSYKLTGGGWDRHDAQVEGAFAGIRTRASNFTFVARVQRRPGETADPQFGLSMRAADAAVDGKEECVNIRLDGRGKPGKWRWLMRHFVTRNTHAGSGRSYLYGIHDGISGTDKIWIKLVRRWPFVHGYLSENGKDWEEVGSDYLKVLVSQEVVVGPLLTAGARGQTPSTLVCDNISFTDDGGDAETEKEVCVEHHPKMKTWTMHLAKVETGRKSEPVISPFLLMPKGMDPKKIRALVWSGGSKEITVNGKAFAFDKGEGRLRKPTVMKDWQGKLDIEGLHPNNLWLEHYQLARLGGFFRAEHYREAVEGLAKVSGIKFLPNIPYVITGASFAGGITARAAAEFPEMTVAAAPTLIGMAGAKTDERRVLDVPHLHVFGSKDSGSSHLKEAIAMVPGLNQKKALWATAPMWRVQHDQHRSFSMIQPYFLDLIDLRVPRGADFSKGPTKLKRLKREKGWFGLCDTWSTNCPEITPMQDYKGGSDFLAWLPSEHSAVLWRAYVSENPKPIIHFPRCDGTSNYGLPQPDRWHNSVLKAGEPFNVVASGPRADDLQVEYFDGLRNLKVLEGENYRVTLEGLPAGLHSLYMIVTADGKKEVSSLRSCMFVKP